MSGTEGFPFGRGYFGRGFYSRVTLFNVGLPLRSTSSLSVGAVFTLSGGIRLASKSSVAIGGERMWMPIAVPPCAPWGGIEVEPCGAWGAIAVPPCAPWETVAASQNPFLGVWPA